MNRSHLRFLPPLLLAALVALLLAGLAAAGGPGVGPAAVPRLDPPAPVNITFDSDVLSVAVQGDYAYVGLEKAGVAVLDISDPLHPIIISTFDDPDPSGLNYVDELIPNGDILIIPYGSVFYVVDISDPAHPAWLSYSHDAAYELKAMALYDQRAYGLGPDSFEIWDLQDPSSPQLLYSMRDQYHRLFSDMQQIAVARNPADGRIYAYMTGEPLCFHDCIGNGLVFVDVTDPSQPQVVYTSRWNGVTLAAQEEYLYWSDSDASLQILGLTDPRQPELLSRIDLADIGFAMDRKGNRLFLALAYGEDGQIDVIDVTNKTKPTSMTRYEDVKHGKSLSHSDETGCLFVAELSRGLRILCDINANPQPPAQVWLPLIGIQG